MYRIFDIGVASNIPLPELPETQLKSPTLYFTSGSESLFGLKEPDWFYNWYANGSLISSSCARTDEGYLMRYHDLADFLISSDEGTILAHPAPTTRRDTVRHLLLDDVIPRILGQQGRLVLHASAVELQGETGVAFLGSSGWGKSTIASSFSQNGARLLTDDCLLVDVRDEQIIAIPNYKGVRLYSDSVETIFPGHPGFSRLSDYSDKKKLILHERTDTYQKTELQAMFLLGDPSDKTSTDEIKIVPVGGADSIMTIIKRVFLLDVKELQAVAKLFTGAGRITSTGLSIFSLTYPRDYTKLDDLRAAVLSVVNQLPGKRTTAVP